MNKRFAPSELAAEAYRQMIRAGAQSGLEYRLGLNGDIETMPGDALTFGPVRLETARLSVIKAFAILPNFDEVPE